MIPPRERHGAANHGNLHKSCQFREIIRKYPIWVEIYAKLAFIVFWGSLDCISAPGPMEIYWNYSYFCMPAQTPAFSQKPWEPCQTEDFHAKTLFLVESHRIHINHLFSVEFT